MGGDKNMVINLPLPSFNLKVKNKRVYKLYQDGIIDPYEFELLFHPKGKWYKNKNSLGENEIDKWNQKFNNTILKISNIMAKEGFIDLSYIQFPSFNISIFKDIKEKKSIFSFKGSFFWDIANFSNYNFNKSVNFTQSIFFKDVDFHNSTFKNGSFFLGSIFLKNANFINCTFYEDANFFLTFFSKEARFWESTFLKDAIFINSNYYGMADFSKSQFGKFALFQRSNFYANALFSKALFLDFTDFTESNFYKSVFFTKSTFKKELYFLNVLVKEKSIFAGAILEDIAYF